MTAGVQNLEPAAAYLPSQASPSAHTNAITKIDSDASDFQSEMDRHHEAPESKSTSRPQTDSEKKTGSPKPAGKKQNAKPSKDEASAAPVAAAAPVQVVEPQRHILPITMVPGQPVENADEGTGDNALPDAVAQEALSAGELSVDDASPTKVSQNEVIPPKTGRNDAPVKTRPASGHAAGVPEKVTGWRAALESPDVEPSRQSETGPLTTDPIATNQIVTNDLDASQHDANQLVVNQRDANQVAANPLDANQAASGQPVATSQPQRYVIQPVLQTELKVPVPELTPLEPAPAAATQKIVDAAPSSPSALAFAARLPVVTPDNTNAVVPDRQVRPLPGSDSPSPIRIPMRYAATAQIIQRAEQKFEADLDARVDPTKYAEPALDRSARTDLILPGAGPATHEAVGNSSSPRNPEPAPTARTERVIEPPAAAPTSSRDIRVQVPDNNGGSTQVRFLESGGEVRVSVRTADAGLAQTLRSHLSDLSQRLAESGAPAEIWKPAAGAASPQNHQHQADREGRGSGGQNSGSHSGQHAGTQGDPRDQEDRPAWLEEMEASLLARK